MRAYRVSTLVSIGVLAMVGAGIAPGVASAAENPATETATYVFAGNGVINDGLEYSITPHDNWTVTFTLNKLTGSTPWKSRSSYQVDGEGAYIPADPNAPYVTPRDIYRPVLATDPNVPNVAPYDISTSPVTVDPTKQRKVPKGAGGTDYEVVTVDDVAPYATGEHTIAYAPYSGAYAESLPRGSARGCRRRSARAPRSERLWA